MSALPQVSMTSDDASCSATAAAPSSCASMLALASALYPLCLLVNAPHSAHSVRTRGAFLMARADMPEQLAEWGCDVTLWSAMPPGACRDLARFAATNKEELAKQRLETMREIMTVSNFEQQVFTEDSWPSWNKAVSTWEAKKAADEAAAKQAAKDAKKAAAKAKREAEAAAAEAAA